MGTFFSEKRKGVQIFRKIFPDGKNASGETIGMHSRKPVVGCVDFLSGTDGCQAKSETRIASRRRRSVKPGTSIVECKASKAEPNAIGWFWDDESRFRDVKSRLQDIKSRVQDVNSHLQEIEIQLSAEGYFL